MRVGASMLAVSVAVALGGCGGDDRRIDPPRGPEGGVLRFDAAMIPSADASTPSDGGARDARAPVQCEGLPPATTVGGVLTAYPHIDLTLVDAGFRVLSINYIIKVDDDSRGPLLTLLAEIERTSSEIECGYLPDIFLDGVDLVGLIDTPPYYSEYVDTVPDDCLGYGDVGVLRALARGVTSEDLATAASLYLEVNPNTFGEQFRATNGPILMHETASTTEGWVLRGTVEPVVDIYNYLLEAYVRDGRGLLTADLLAYPRELANMYAGEVIDYESTATPCPFVEALTYQGWILQRTGISLVLPSARDAVVREQARRKAEMLRMVEPLWD